MFLIDPFLTSKTWTTERFSCPRCAEWALMENFHKDRVNGI